MKGAKKDAGRLRLEAPALEGRQGHALRLVGHGGPSDGQADLKLGAPRQLGEAFLGQHALDGAHAQFEVFLGEQLDDLPGRELALAPSADLLAERGGHPASGRLALWRGLVQVEFAGAEQVAEQAHVAGLVAEAIAHGRRRKALDEAGPQRLVAALPVGFWMGEEGSVAHDPLSSMTLINVNVKS